jgi:hypothetical protein
MARQSTPPDYISEWGWHNYETGFDSEEGFLPYYFPYIHPNAERFVNSRLRDAQQRGKRQEDQGQKQAFVFDLQHIARLQDIGHSYEEAREIMLASQNVHSFMGAAQIPPAIPSPMDVAQRADKPPGFSAIPSFQRQDRGASQSVPTPMDVTQRVDKPPGFSAIPSFQRPDRGHAFAQPFNRSLPSLMDVQILPPIRRATPRPTKLMRREWRKKAQASKAIQKPSTVPRPQGTCSTSRAETEEDDAEGGLCFSVCF